MNGRKQKTKKCDGADESFLKVMKDHFSSEKEARNAFAQMKAQINRLEEVGYLRSPDKMRKESTLPDGNDFYAIKTPKRLRAYGWYSRSCKGVFFISHFAFKKGQKLDQKDTNLIVKNWWKHEKNGG